jgi:hypothetical protein
MRASKLEETRSMRHGMLWTLAFLVMPALAAAEGVQVNAVDAARTDTAPDSGQHTGASDTPFGLDLRIDPTQLPGEALAADPAPIGSRPAEHHGVAAPPAAERGLSFGVEVQPRRATDGLARNLEADQPGLQDDLERLMEHSTLGVRGIYRF